MTDRKEEFNTSEDLQLERLFASMDEVKASDSLKASTLRAIFDQLGDDGVQGGDQATDGSQVTGKALRADATQLMGATRVVDATRAVDAAQVTDATQVVGATQGTDATQTVDATQLVDATRFVDTPHAADATVYLGASSDPAEDQHPAQVSKTIPRLLVVEGGAGKNGQAGDAGTGSEALGTAGSASYSAGLHDVDDPSVRAKRPGKAKASRSKGAWKRRVAAVLLVAALVAGGGAAYALPATHVLASTGDITFDLGVNVFGITVSANASNDAGQQVLQNVDVHNVRFQDAFDRLLDAYEAQGGEATPTVAVAANVPIPGMEARFTQQARDVIDVHEQRKSAGAAGESGSGYVPQDSEQQYTPQDQGGNALQGGEQGMSGQQPSGEQPSAGQPSGEQATGGQSTGEQAAGEQSGGVDPAGNQSSGGQPSGEQPASDQAASGAGDQSQGGDSAPADGGSDMGGMSDTGGAGGMSAQEGAGPMG